MIGLHFLPKLKRHEYPEPRFKKISKGHPASKKAFQLKYTWSLLFSIFGVVAIFLAVSYWKLYENYQIFRQLALRNRPELLIHLERELTLFVFFAVVLAAGALFICLAIGWEITGKILKITFPSERPASASFYASSHPRELLRHEVEQEIVLAKKINNNMAPFETQPSVISDPSAEILQLPSGRRAS